MLNIQRYHVYELTMGSMAQNGTDTDSFQIDTGYDFYWIKSMAYVYNATFDGQSAVTWPRITVVLSDGATQQQVSNQEVNLSNAFGTAQLPFILPKPHKVRGGATFSATTKNYHATAYSVGLAFAGVHVPAGQPLSPRAMRQALR